MDREFMSLLACPRCQGQLELRPEAAAPHQVLECVCRICRVAFAVNDGIANFLLEEATPLHDERSPLGS